MPAKNLEIAALVCILFIICSQVALCAGEKSYAQYVPENTLFFMEAVDLQSAWNGLETSNFWKKFSSLELLEKLGARQKINDLKTKFQSVTGMSLSEENVMSFLGKRAATAVFAEAENAKGPIKIEIVFIVQCNPRKTVEDMLLSAFKNAKERMNGPEDKFTSEVYGEKKINSIRTKSGESIVEIRYVFDADTLILGVGNMRPRIEKFLDCSNNKEKSLTKLSGFMKIRTILSPLKGDSLVFMFADNSKIDSLKETMGEGRLDFIARIRFMADKLGKGSISGLSMVIDKGIKIKTFSLTPKENAPELELLRFQAAPSEGTNRNFIPKDTILYAAGNNTANLAKAYSLIMKQEQSGASRSLIFRIAKQIEQSLKIDFEKDFMPLLDNEIAFISSGFDVKADNPPVLLAAIMLKVKNKAKATAFMGEILQNMQADAAKEKGESKPMQEKYEGVEIYTVKMPNPFADDSHSLQICYAFMDDFLVFSSSMQFAKSMIDVSKGRSRGFLEGSLYKGAGIPAKTNRIFFINWTALIENAKTAVDWFVVCAESAGWGEKAVQITKERLNPLINVLEVIKDISFYSLNTPQGEETNLYIRLEDLPGI